MKSHSEFVIIVVYVDAISLIVAPKEIVKVVAYLRKEFEIKSLEQTKYCLGMQIEYVSIGILFH